MLAADAGAAGSAGGTLAGASVDSDVDGWGAVSVDWGGVGVGSSGAGAGAGVAADSVGAAASLSGGCGSVEGPAIDGGASGCAGDLSEFMMGGASLGSSAVGRASGCGSEGFWRVAIAAARSGGHIELFAYGDTWASQARQMSMTWCGWRRARYWRLSSWSCGPAQNLYLRSGTTKRKSTWWRDLVVAVVVGVLKMLRERIGGHLHCAGEQLHSFSPQGSRATDAQNKQVSRPAPARSDALDRKFNAIGSLPHSAALLWSLDASLFDAGADTGILGIALIGRDCGMWRSRHKRRAF